MLAEHQQEDHTLRREHTCCTGEVWLKDREPECMQVVELPGHPFYVAAQFHPEFKSRPGKPSALFQGLVLAASGKLDNFLSGGSSLDLCMLAVVSAAV